LHRLRYFLKRNSWIFLLLVVGCSSALKEVEQAEKDKVGTQLFQYYARNFPITVFPFTYQGRETNFLYLEDALAETVGVVLQTMEKQSVVIDGKEYVRLRGFPEALETQIVSAKVASWKMYIITNQSIVTQKQLVVLTNAWLVTTNTNLQEKTTNFLRFCTNQYEAFLQKEFSSLMSEISRLPVSWSYTNDRTNMLISNAMPLAISTNSYGESYTYRGEIRGRFMVQQNPLGPSEVQVTIEMVKILATHTNRGQLTLKTTEDKLYEKILEKQGEIRRFYLGDELASIEVVSEPEGVDFYIDGQYIGRTPLFYDSILPGKHSLRLLREGYSSLYADVVLSGKTTNRLKFTLEGMDRSGVVILDGESNRMVFLNSRYEGVTPLVISNLFLSQSYTILLRSDDRNYEDIYTSFVLTREKPTMVLTVGKGRSIQQRQWQRNVAYGLCYTSWGITLGLMVGHWYTSALEEYYRDQLYNPLLTDSQQAAYASQVALYSHMRENLFSYGILSSLLSLALTGYALSTEEVYVEYNSQQKIWGVTYRKEF